MKHLVHVFSTFVPAGPQVRTAKLMAAFGVEFRHTIIAMDGQTAARKLLEPALDVRFEKPPPKAGTLVTARRMRALLRRLAPDLVLTYNFGAIDAVIAARTAGLAVIHHEDGFLPDEAQSLKRRRVWLRRLVLRGATRVVVISENLRRIAREQWRIPESHLHFVPNGIAVEQFDAADGNLELRQRLGIPSDALVIGAVGHLRPEKNLPRLLRAVARCVTGADLHVLVLGEGPERERIEDLARRPPLAGRVHFAGHQSDPRAFYRAMDVFALTSDTEQMPIALLEAMACSLPALVTDVGDVRSMLPPEQSPFVVALGPGADERLSRSLLELAGSPSVRRTLGSANRRRVAERHAHEHMVARYRELFSSSF